MSSENVIKCVAKKLRYYFEVKRLEDGFDLSGTQAPKLSHPPLKPRPTLQYDGLHDRPVKHFFSSPEIRAHITQMDKKFSTELEREKTIRTLVEHYIAQYRFHPVSLPEYAYMHTRKGKKLRNESIGFGIPRSNKRKQLKGGKPRLRCHPPHYISKGEAGRLINVATKLLAATGPLEGVNSSTVQSSLSSNKSSLPDIACQKPQAQPPYSRPKTARGRLSQGDLYVFDRSGHRIAAPTLNDGVDSLDSACMTHSPGSDDWRRRKRREQQGDASQNQWTRPRPESLSDNSSVSDAEAMSSQGGNYSYEQRPPEGHSVCPPPAIIRDIMAPDLTSVTVLHSIQPTENVAIQTDNKLLDSYDYMDDLVEAGPACEYQVFVRTGTRIGASTEADVKLTLYGENGRAAEVTLAESKRHKIKFQKGKEDLFILSSPHLGKLRKIKIGHDRTEIAYGWFLEGVSVYDMLDKRIYEFVCERWLSSQDTDRQTYRELSLDSDRAIIDDNDSITSSTFPMNQTEIKPKEEGENVKDMSTDSASMLAKNSKDGDTLSSSESDSSDSSSESGDSQESGAKKETVHKDGLPLENAADEVKRNAVDDFFDQASSGPVFTFRSVSSDADTEIPELPESQDTSDPSEKPATPYFQGYKDGIEAAHVKGGNQKELLESEKKDIVQGEGIHEAARGGHLQLVKELMHDYPEMAASRDGAGWNALHISSSEGHVDVVKWLLASSVNIDEETPTGYTAVHVAAMNGHVNMLMILCAMGANVNSESMDKQTPLHLAAKHGHLESVKWLIANRADISAADNFGRVALDLSQEYEQTEVTKLLESCEAELCDINSNLAQLRAAHQTVSAETATDSLTGDHRLHKVHFDWNTNEQDGKHVSARSETETDALKDKKIRYDKHQTKMKATGDSFLDSIRQELYD